MKTCPNCNRRVPEDFPLCPFCATVVATGERLGTGKEAEERTAVSSGMALGCGLTVAIYYLCGAFYIIAGNMLFAASHGMPHVDRTFYLHWRSYGPWLGFLLPICLLGLLYLLLRRRYPKFARGLGYSCVAAAVIALGGPFICSRPG